MDNNKIGKFIASRRKELGLTQQTLADKLYVTDKAVSKWERGLSLPDITLLRKLAKILKVDVADILDGQIGTTKKINIEEEIERIKRELSIIHKNKINKLIISIIVLIIIVLYIIFRNISLDYRIDKLTYLHSNREINLGVPKTSFMMKHRDKSYSYKNFRNANIIENEIKKYLKTLKYSTCNDTIYYYNELDNFSIIEYSVKNHFLYNTISYQVEDNDYCLKEKMNEYSKKLNGLNRIHNFGGTSISYDKDWNELLVVHFIDGGNAPNKGYQFIANMQVIYLKRKDKTSSTTKVLEESTGDFEIKDDKLYYYRKEVKEQAKDITIPEVTIFKIEDGNLILTDNYLKKYTNKEIILK